MSLKPVYLESPYAANEKCSVDDHVRYARACMRDCLLNYHEAPYASHLLYTQDGILDDLIPQERTLGIEAGLVWGRHAQATVVYTDLGTSRGMQYGIAAAAAAGRPVYYRQLSSAALRALGIDAIAKST